MTNMLAPCRHAVVAATVLGYLFVLALSGAEAKALKVPLTRIGVATPGSSGFAVINESADGRTEVTIHIRRAQPDTFYTVWILLGGPSPLGGRADTPLAPTTAITDLLAVTPPNPGSTEVVNGFFTDDEGNGAVHVNLDFLLSAGVYPFERFQSNLPPVAMGQAGHLLRVVSHPDGLGHGLIPSPAQRWFDLVLE